MRRTDRRIGIVCLCAAVSIQSNAMASTGLAIPNDAIVQPATVYEADLSAADDGTRPVLASFGVKSQPWSLKIQAPVVWTDDDGNSHEVEQLNGAWRRWINTFGPKLLSEWQRNPAYDKKIVSATVSLRTPKQVGGIQFTPEQEESEKQFSDFVQTVTGLSRGKQLSEIMPEEARNATALYLNLKFEQNERKRRL